MNSTVGRENTLCSVMFNAPAESKMLLCRWCAAYISFVNLLDPLSAIPEANELIL